MINGHDEFLGQYVSTLLQECCLFLLIPLNILHVFSYLSAKHEIEYQVRFRKLTKKYPKSYPPHCIRLVFLKMKVDVI